MSTSKLLGLVLDLGAPSRWDQLRDHLHKEWGWLTTPDERVLWAMLAAAALLAAWGAWAGWRRRE